MVKTSLVVLTKWSALTENKDSIVKLYDYFRSTAAYRLRIALLYKGLDYQSIPIHLVNNGGEQHGKEYRAINPQELIPSLTDGSHTLTQSLAILEYLEEKYPSPPLLPEDIVQRAHARSIAQMVVCDIHPLNNLRVLQYLTKTLEHSEEEKLSWYRHWVALGFSAIEARLQDMSRNKPVCVGDSISLADICLIPQVYNAHRFGCPMDAYPLINAINEHCLGLDAFYKSAPE